MPLVRTSIAAEAIGVRHKTLARWWRNGLVQPDSITLGGHPRWDVADLRRQLIANPQLVVLTSDQCDVIGEALADDNARQAEVMLYAARYPNQTFSREEGFTDAELNWISQIKSGALRAPPPGTARPPADAPAGGPGAPAARHHPARPLEPARHLGSPLLARDRLTPSRPHQGRLRRRSAMSCAHP